MKYPHKRGTSKTYIAIILLLTFVFAYLFYQVHNVKIKIESMPVETYQKPKDPCIELRNLDDQNKTQIVALRQRQSALLSEMALEVEIAMGHGRKGISVDRLKELLIKYDNTETKLYQKLYNKVK